MILLGQALCLGFTPMILAHPPVSLSSIITTLQRREQTFPEGESSPWGLAGNIL